VFRTSWHNLKSDLAVTQPGWLRGLPAAHRKALALTLISVLGWSVWNGTRSYSHPWGDLSRGKFTDHFSHMNAARLFPRVGHNIWRVPIGEMFGTLTADQFDRLPDDVKLGASGTGGIFAVPGWPADKPLAISWSNKTRMYPPGDMLLVAPIAALYHYTRLSLTGACRMLLGWFIVLAHVALFYFFLMFFEGKSRGIDWLACFFAYSQIMYWTLEGFYDAAAIAPLILCARYLGQRRGLAAGVAYCVGAILHFRVFFQAPWAIFAAGLMVRERFWRHLSLRHVVAILVAATFASISLYVFWLDWRSLGKVAINNPLRFTGGAHNKALIWNIEVLSAVCGAAFLFSRAWFDLVSLAWLGLIIFGLREFYVWHLLVSMSWIAAPVRRPTARAVRIAFLLSSMTIMFNDTFVPNWVWMLHKPW
jgi:hypothetical protein